jgi:hypothetical protein
MSRLEDVGDSRKTWTFSTWLKRCNLDIGVWLFTAGADVDNASSIYISSGNVLTYIHKDGGANTDWVYSVNVLRDCSNWYHILVAMDTTQAVEADRLRMYINSVEVAYDGTNYPALNADTDFCNGETAYLGVRTGGSGYLDGYLAETHIIDNQALTPSSFGLTKNGVWVPKVYIGAHGANGSYLDYGDSGALGTDKSGNANNWGITNLAANDQVPDTPTNNYCVWSAINNGYTGDLVIPTLSDGSLLVDEVASAAKYATSTIALPSSGVWEYKIVSSEVNNTDKQGWFGFIQECERGGLTYGYAPDGDYWNGTAWVGYGATWTNADVMTVVADVDNGTLHFWKNGADQGEAATGLDLVNALPIMKVKNNELAQVVTDFGQHGFTKNGPNSAYLCSKNMPDPLMKVGNASRFFHTELYTGTGAEKTITGMDFQPDLVWTKSRSAATEHVLIDSVRGATKELNCNDASIEETVAQSVKSFTSDGYVLGTDASVNANTKTFVGWCLKKSAVAGFDIVVYEGTGIAHGINHSLGAAPELMIVKNLISAATNWRVYHHKAIVDGDAAPETDRGILDSTAAFVDSNTEWDDTAPTSTQFTVGTGLAVNKNGENHVAFLFRGIEGFSKCFTYIGNGNADGPFVDCGFRPQYILVRKVKATSNWLTRDNIRATYNPAQLALFPNLVDVEADNAIYAIDICANGFKIRGASGDQNTNNEDYIGIAFADQPFKYANAF